jgi:hypothetical protein
MQAHINVYISTINGSEFKPIKRNTWKHMSKHICYKYQNQNIVPNYYGQMNSYVLRKDDAPQNL